MLVYKGHVGTVAYDDVTDALCARVVNSGSYSVAEAEATDVEGIKREFRKSIDVYLGSCAEDGVEPVAPTEIPRRVSGYGGLAKGRSNPPLEDFAPHLGVAIMEDSITLRKSGS